MYFCGSFCNGVPDQPQVLVTPQQAEKLRQSQEKWNEPSQRQLQQSKKQDKTYAMIKLSKYNKYYAESKQANRKFTDKQFPPNEKSLDFKVEQREITWKRISQIIPNFVMCEKGINPGDIQQGNIGDCYFLASVSALAQNPLLIENIFLNNFQENGFGLYKVIANINGVLTQIVIDDYIPVFAKTERPVFCKSNGKQVWTMLLQKAWAKIKGSYGKINRGNPYEVLNTFSLAPVYNYRISKKINPNSEEADSIWHELLRSDSYNYPSVAGTRPNISLNGLKPQHSYTVLKSGDVKSGETRQRIMRLRNPWGNTQYNGPFSEDDKKFWDKVDKQVKNQFIPQEGVDDGVFTIPYSIFLQNFDTIDMVHFREGYSLFFKEMFLSKDAAGYIELQVTNQHQAYITAQKSYETEAVKQHIQKTKQYGHIRIVLAKQVPSSQIHEGHEHKYEYYASNYENNCCQISVFCNLKPGKYKALIDSGYPEGFNQNYKIISSYYYERIDKSQSKKFKVSVNEDKLAFLQNLYLDHAHKLPRKTPLSGRPKDWVKSAVLKYEGGLAYIACSLDSQTNFKLKITCDQNQIQENGFYLWSSYDSYIEPGTEKIFLFSFEDIGDNQKDLQFPPKGFKISKQM